MTVHAKKMFALKCALISLKHHYHQKGDSVNFNRIIDQLHAWDQREFRGHADDTYYKR